MARYAGLPRSSWAIVFESWLDAVRVKVQLRTPWRRRLFQPRTEHTTRRLGLANVEIQRLAGLVDLSFQSMPATCLERALVLQRLLQRRGVGTVLQIGVRKDEDLLQAHAWLEHPALPADSQSFEFLPLQPGTAGSAFFQ